MNIDQLSNPIVKAAFTAVNNNDQASWLALFGQGAILTDDGDPSNLAQWSTSELFGKGNGRILNIDGEEADGLTINTLFHSNVWGEFKAFWKFEIQAGKIIRLDVGQIDT